MPKIILYDRELADGRVPKRCLVCGQEAEFHNVDMLNRGPFVLRWFVGRFYVFRRWGKPRLNLGGGSGFLGTSLARVPLCTAHQNHFRAFGLFNIIWLVCALLLIPSFFVAFFGLFFASILSTQVIGWAGFALWPVLAIGLFIVLVFVSLSFYIIHDVMWFRTTYVTHWDDNYTTVHNAASEFAAALEAMRADPAARVPMLEVQRPDRFEERRSDDDYSHRERERSDEEYERRFPRRNPRHYREEDDLEVVDDD
jgi:hypothetical protein